MKTTPFQLALKNELSRLERLSHNDNESPSPWPFNYVQGKPTKNKHFLLQFFQRMRLPRRHVLSF